MFAQVNQPQTALSTNNACALRTNIGLIKHMAFIPAGNKDSVMNDKIRLDDAFIQLLIGLQAVSNPALVGLGFYDDLPTWNEVISQTGVAIKALPAPMLFETFNELSAMSTPPMPSEKHVIRLLGVISHVKDAEKKDKFAQNFSAVVLDVGYEFVGEFLKLDDKLHPVGYQKSPHVWFRNTCRYLALKYKEMRDPESKEFTESKPMTHAFLYHVRRMCILYVTSFYERVYELMNEICMHKTGVKMFKSLSKLGMVCAEKKKLDEAVAESQVAAIISGFKRARAP
jgi:hypothetical protein